MLSVIELLRASCKALENWDPPVAASNGPKAIRRACPVGRSGGLSSRTKRPFWLTNLSYVSLLVETLEVKANRFHCHISWWKNARRRWSLTYLRRLVKICMLPYKNGAG
ncbi:hypothetical protein [Microvirga zambiensis]|uniref:hypothetical protein n=1 Tax=Microvirga zambiensis TaxID=1402137 RepID=UPI00191F44FF|nr:hypothetical protein [Microvirga zambiensis]